MLMALIIFGLVGNALAFDSIDYATDSLDFAEKSFESSDIGIARAPDYIICTARTEVWKDPPYSTINNSIVFYAEKDYKFNLKGLYTDPYGGTWYKVTSITIMPGAEGYISTKYSKNVVGG